MSTNYPPNPQDPYGQGEDNPYGPGSADSYDPNSVADAYGAATGNPQDPYGQAAPDPHEQGPAAYGSDPYQQGYPGPDNPTPPHAGPPATMPPPGMPVTVPPKKSKTWIILLVVGLIVLALVIAVAVALGRALARGGSSDPSRQGVPASRAGYTPPEGAKAISDTVTLTDSGGSATVKILSATWTTTGTNRYSTPDHGHFLVLDVQYQGRSGKLSYSPSDWKVKDKDNREYDTTYESAATPRLKYGDLTSGETVRGYVAFDVTQGDVIVTVTPGYNATPIKFGVPSPK